MPEEAIKLDWDVIRPLRESLSSSPSESYITQVLSEDVRKGMLKGMPQFFEDDKKSIGSSFVGLVFVWHQLCLSLGRDSQEVAKALLGRFEEELARYEKEKFSDTFTVIRYTEEFLTLPKGVWQHLRQLITEHPHTSNSPSISQKLIKILDQTNEAEHFFLEAEALQGEPHIVAEALLDNLKAQFAYFESPEFVSADKDWRCYWNKETRRIQVFIKQPESVRKALLLSILKRFTNTKSDGKLVTTFIYQLLDHLFSSFSAIESDLGEPLIKLMSNKHDFSLYGQTNVTLRQYVRQLAEDTDLPDALLATMRRTVLRYQEYSSHDSYKAQLAELRTFIASRPDLVLNPGEAWADCALAELEALPETSRGAWQGLLRHAATATSSKPSNKWLKTAKAHVDTVTPDALTKSLLVWLPLVGKPRTFELRDHDGISLDPYNVLVLRGLVWCASTLPSSKALGKTLVGLVMSALKKVPRVGVRSGKLITAVVVAFGQWGDAEATNQLAQLSSKVTFKPALKEIDKALNTIAEKTGLSREDLEELSIPTFGFDASGSRVETLGDATATLHIALSSVSLTWQNAAGKTLKSPPAAVRQGFAEELKELKAVQKDAARQLSVIAARLDNLYLQHKSWAFEAWQERYLQHPLVLQVARRLIWEIDGKSVGVTAAGFEDAEGNSLTFKEDATVRLWHPLEHQAEISAWQAWLEARGVTQPFKQAHREIYRLTAAEEATRTYSNRFAGHILKQHQFNALCGVRGWHNSLRLMVDDVAPPARLELPHDHLRAEYWVEGAGDEYGRDTTEAGTYLYISTDQVRFYPLGVGENVAHMDGSGYHPSGRFPLGAEPLPLAEILPLVFSEVMRDVDLFVGVSSLGNDPAWQDNGEGYGGYWQSYSFGELSATAETRKALLAKLLPRLSLKDRCTLEGRFLGVQGKLRRYKIHLGSTNILMEPHNEYLCIVPSRGAPHEPAALVLPFEGDSALWVILSKAFLLAEDDKITDPVIVQQLKRAH